MAISHCRILVQENCCFTARTMPQRDLNALNQFIGISNVAIVSAGVNAR